MRRGRAPRGRHRQEGVALLLAILLVAIATILAAAIGYGSAMAARRGAAAIAFDEGLLVAEAAEAFAAFGLRADFRTGTEFDFPGEAWGKPVGPIEVTPGVQLEASLEDVQGRFNLNSLVGPNGIADAESVLIFQRLLEMVGLEPKWAQLMADWIDTDSQPGFPDGAEDNFYTTQNPPYRTPNMLITSSTELLALPGFGRDRYLKIAPYVTALPQDARINICSASGFVLDAMIEGRVEFGSDPKKLATSRQSACFPKLTDYVASFGGDTSGFSKISQRISQNSHYFRLTSIVSIGTTQFALYSLLLRDTATGMVRPIQRSFVAD
jgi:general secretion pathway protein K